MKKIVFTGGGTLGHVMPNLYLINELSDYEIHYIGGNGIEKQKLKDFNVKYHEIPTTKLVRGKFFVNLKIPFVLIKAIRQSKKILKEIKPDVVFSKGGYVSLPVCLAARKLKIPIIAHESDYSFGLANRIILKLCTTMCVNFKNLESKNRIESSNTSSSAQSGRKNKIVYTGPVLGKNFENSQKDYSKLNIDKSKQTILIVGGSLGSQIINQNIYPILNDLLKDFNIIHITGKGNNKIKSYDSYISMEMTDNIVNLYNIADIVIGRAGAGVTAECYYKQLPMILIPLENGSSRGDQLQNAKYYTNQGVATILQEKDLTPTNLLSTVKNFSSNLNKYSQNYFNTNKINGREKIIQMIRSASNSNQTKQ